MRRRWLGGCPWFGLGGADFSILVPCYSLPSGVRNLTVHLPSNWYIFVFLLFIDASMLTCCLFIYFKPHTHSLTNYLYKPSTCSIHAVYDTNLAQKEEVKTKSYVTMVVRSTSCAFDSTLFINAQIYV